MNELNSKFFQLDTFYQKQVIDFVEFLLSKMPIEKTNNLKSYKKKILNVSVWTEEDLEVFQENKKLFNKSKIK